jgi:hypothetical protein
VCVWERKSEREGTLVNPKARQLWGNPRVRLSGALFLETLSLLREI